MKKLMTMSLLSMLLFSCANANKYSSTSSNLYGDNSELKSFIEEIDFSFDTDSFIYDSETISLNYNSFIDSYNKMNNQKIKKLNEINENKSIYREKFDFNSDNSIIEKCKDFFKVFFILAELTNKDFTTYCGKYSPIMIEDHQCYARIQINETIGELEYSLLMGQSFYNFSAYYVSIENEVITKHVEKQEGDSLYIIANYFDYTLVDNKISFPINTFCVEATNEEENGFLQDFDKLNSEDEFHFYDVKKAYSLLKYPHQKALYSDILKTLLLIGTKEFDKLPPLLDVIDHYLNQSTNVSASKINGLNFTSNPIYIEKSENGYAFKDNELIVNCLNCSIFRIDGGYLALYFYDGLKGVYIRINAEITIEKYVVTFTFPKEIPQNHLLNFSDESLNNPIILHYCFENEIGETYPIIDFCNY